MAILFKQSRNKERIFIWTVIIFSISFSFSVSLFIFPPFEDYSSYEGQIFEQYDAKIDLGLIDSEKVKNLRFFLEEIKTEFSFIAQDKNGKKIEGNISALNKEEAESILKDKGLTILNINEYYSIKNDPFSPYYQPK